MSLSTPAGERTTARHELEPQGEIRNWFGSLVDDMRDASGQMYKRNRYYDPQTGQFTQPDPIGIAGGLNEYGFAEGDPVSYDDPYGLEAADDCLTRPFRCARDVWARYQAWGERQERDVIESATELFMRTGSDRRQAEQLAQSALGLGMAGSTAAARETEVLQRLGTRMFNQLKAVDSRHLNIARQELRGVITGWDHVTEVRDAMQGLRNTVYSLRGMLSNPNTSEQAREIATGLLRRASRALDVAERAMN